MADNNRKITIKNLDTFLDKLETQFKHLFKSQIQVTNILFKRYFKDKSSDVSKILELFDLDYLEKVKIQHHEHGIDNLSEL